MEVPITGIEGDFDLSDWEDLTKKRDQWRRVVSDGLKTHDEAWLGMLARRRMRWHEGGGLNAPLLKPGNQSNQSDGVDNIDNIIYT
ncbi:unnamed protein product [Arctia plantaginis]|uniref:Uncharacterized protein n=1 Tax=Arctia plantaginis TaxID=874455 RepID=A0A8S0ZUZ8_ARCPL|nr:unnamed protein product [Arctia plantaginis]